MPTPTVREEEDTPTFDVGRWSRLRDLALEGVTGASHPTVAYEQADGAVETELERLTALARPATPVDAARLEQARQLRPNTADSITAGYVPTAAGPVWIPPSMVPWCGIVEDVCDELWARGFVLRPQQTLTFVVGAVRTRFGLQG